MRTSDTVSRQGGDEFVALLSEVEHSEDAALTARRMLEAVAEPHIVDHHELHVTASIGVSVFPEDGLDLDTLVKNADTAMYQAKAAGRQGYQFFAPSMHVRAAERQFIDEGLRRALKRHELVLHYQAKVQLDTGEIIGAEALLRWLHPVRGTIAAADFVPVAVDCGLILPVGRWALQEACRQAAAWHDAGLPLATISVNIAARELHDAGFVASVFAALENTGLNPCRLELDLTESLLMSHSESTEAILRELRAQGVRMAVDDFGTGCSSLSSLSRFPIDTINMDRSFLRQKPATDEEANIAAAVIGLGQSLKMRVVAEGVETREDVVFLLEQGCEAAQGNYFSAPLAAPDFATLLAQRARLTSAATLPRASGAAHGDGRS